MSNFHEIDATLHPWAEANRVKLLTEFAGREERFFYISSDAGEVFQISVHEAPGDDVQVKAWSVETTDDAEFHRAWTVPLAHVDEQLAQAVALVRSWMERAHRS